jgi:hypothetical protein
MSTPTVQLAPFLSFPHDYYTAMIQASDLTNFYSLQPSSSQFPRDEEAVERAFWQSTTTALEELREGTEDVCHQKGAFIVSHSSAQRSYPLYRDTSLKRSRQTERCPVSFNTTIQAHSPNMDVGRG